MSSYPKHLSNLNQKKNRIPQQEEATGSGKELKRETLTANLHWLLPAKGLGGGQRWSRRELWDLQAYDPCLLLYERWAHTEKVEILWAHTREILSRVKAVAVSGAFKCCSNWGGIKALGNQQWEHFQPQQKHEEGTLKLKSFAPLKAIREASATSARSRFHPLNRNSEFSNSFMDYSGTEEEEEFMGWCSFSM